MATKAQGKTINQCADEHQHTIVKLIQQVGSRHGIATAFADFVECSAIALSRADFAAADRREARYMQIVKGYQRADLDRFAQAFAHLSQSFEACFSSSNEADDPLPYGVRFDDILGRIYMSLDLGNSGTGQFFTPYHLSLMMTKMVAGNLENHVAEHGFVELNEPACGAGGMVLAQAQTMADTGIDYQKCLHATLIDVDRTCVHMAYVQMSLACIPAVVIHGNSLSLETWDTWYTPVHVLEGWNFRRRGHKNLAQITSSKPAQSAAIPAPDVSAPLEGLAPAMQVETHCGLPLTLEQLQLF